MEPGARRKFGAPMFEPEVFRKQKYLWDCWDFPASPAVIRRQGIVPPPPPSLRLLIVNTITRDEQRKTKQFFVELA